MVRINRFMSPTEFSSSFMSCERDMETILKKLFIDSRPYSETLKRLLVINNKDCLDETNQSYTDLVANMSVADLRENGYIRLEPKITLGQHEETKAYLVLEFNNFSPTSNPVYRDVIIDFNILCHTDTWDLGDYRLRPIKIMGYIDGILNESKLYGIGTLQFMGANEIVLDENLSGYLLRYLATHSSDDLELVEGV